LSIRVAAPRSGLLRFVHGLVVHGFALHGLFVAIVVLAAVVLPNGDAGAQERRGAKPGAFDFYVLAMSWSPAFCALNNNRDPVQCAPGNGNGFVLHGLWPQYKRGYPADCDDRRRPTRDQIATAIPPFPTENLARYEWRKHGSCSGLGPTGYFALAAQAFGKIKQPATFAVEGEPDRVAPLEIERAFSDANAGLTPDKMSVQCRKGLFQEIRICLSKDLRSFVPCPEVDADACRSRSINIEARNSADQ
jgi:ribonuclease T2